MKLADSLMPRTQPNAELHPGLFLGPTSLDLNRYHGGISAERGVQRLVDCAKVIGLASQPFREGVVGDGLRDKIDGEVDESGFGVPVAGLRQTLFDGEGVRSASQQLLSGMSKVRTSAWAQCAIDPGKPCLGAAIALSNTIAAHGLL
jgi:hypothetical protein